MNTTIEDTETPAVATPVVRVSQFGSDAHTLEFVAGQKVSDYLAQADVQLGHTDAITINGEQANIDDPVEAATAIVVTPKVTNG